MRCATARAPRASCGGSCSPRASAAPLLCLSFFGVQFLRRARGAIPLDVTTCTVLLVSVLCSFVYDSLGSALFTVFIAIGLMARTDLADSRGGAHEDRRRRRVRVVRRRGRAAALARAVGRARTSRGPGTAPGSRTATPTSSRASAARGCWSRPTCPAPRACCAARRGRGPAGRPGARPAGALGPAPARSRSPGGRCCACRERTRAPTRSRPTSPSCFGTPVRVGVLLGTRRVNQKPVLQVFDLGGRLLGYAKVGHNELTAALVRREADALAVVGGRRPHARSGCHGSPPRPVGRPRGPGDRHRWSTEARRSRRLPRRAARRHARGRRAWPARTSVDAGTRAASGTALRARASTGCPTEPSGARLAAAADDIERRHGAEPVASGGWHGDWGRWNMGMGDGVLQVWDWERYDPEVPCGLRRPPLRRPGVRPGERDQRRQEEAFLRLGPRRACTRWVSVPAEHDLTLRSTCSRSPRATSTRSRTARRPRCNDVPPGCCRCWSDRATSTRRAYREVNDHERTRRHSPPRQDPGPGLSRCGVGLRHRRAAPAARRSSSSAPSAPAPRRCSAR